jgi:hypothetical protein
MVKQGFLEKDKKLLKARFDWTKQFVVEANTVKSGYKDSNALMISNWPSVQAFMEENANAFFSLDNLKALYRSDITCIRREGWKIFNDIFLFVLFQNMEPFCKKYNAEMVLRTMNMMISNEIDRDLLGYFYRIKPVLAEARGFPIFIKSESDLTAVLGSYD